MIGRAALKACSSESEYSSLPPKPPPVDSEHNASLRQSGRQLKVASAPIQEVTAVTIRSRASRGLERKGALLGSTSRRRTRAVVLLQLPCSPCKQRIG